MFFFTGVSCRGFPTDSAYQVVKKSLTRRQTYNLAQPSPHVFVHGFEHIVRYFKLPSHQPCLALHLYWGVKITPENWNLVLCGHAWPWVAMQAFYIACKLNNKWEKIVHLGNIINAILLWCLYFFSVKYIIFDYIIYNSFGFSSAISFNYIFTQDMILVTILYFV